MLLTVQKRDGRKVIFDKEKIKIAVLKAFIDVDGEETAYEFQVTCTMRCHTDFKE